MPFFRRPTTLSFRNTDRTAELRLYLQLDKDVYDPTTLFRLHDRNGDGYWSYDELNTILLPEIEKLNFSDVER